jgi:PKD repeat protein
MRKNLLFIFSLLVSVTLLNAKPVPVPLAQKVASNFLSNNLHIPVNGLELAYTGSSSVGALFYVFNMNENSGFVIVSADDAVNPIIGYSTHGSYVIPEPGSNFYYWIQKWSLHLANVKSQSQQASPQIGDEWSSYENNTILHRHLSHSPNSVAPLCQTTWDQPSPYNAMCPGGSVTGCVATCMAQIMKYWNYPAHGLDTSFYFEYSPENYGLLFANYDTSNYVWTAMPNSVTSTNHEVAKLMYDCGVSVDMGYSPSESGAWVITADDKICAQSAFVNYFGYDANTIQGLKRKNYSDSAWMALIENELNNNRVVEYVGWDSVNGGHTWVCDGYDTNSFLHMNWGWSGYDNGYYELDTLNPRPYFFSKSEEILIGIEPPPLLAAFDADPLSGCTGTTVNFTDRSLNSSLSGPIVSRQWSFPGGYPASSNALNPSVVYNTPGIYPVTLVVANNNAIDTLTKTTYISISPSNALPFIQAFEGTFPPAQWSISNPWRHATTWQQYTGTGGYGASSHCLYYDNCQDGIKGEYDQVNTPVYDFSSVTNPFLYFDVAYTPYNTTYSDTLAVYYSVDCGQTFSLAYLKGGMNLCTTGGVTVLGGANSNMNGCFLPLSSNWRTDTVMLPSSVAGQSNVMFSFENRSGNGSNIYVDNINVPVPTGINNLTETTSLDVYPNPNTGNFNISFSTVTGTTYQISIYNELGQSVATKTVENADGKYIYPVNLSEFGKGVYSIVLKYGQKQAIEKVAIF